MRLSKKDLKALAREARRLASECMAEDAPELGSFSLRHRNGRPCCVLGHVSARARVFFEYVDDLGPELRDASAFLATQNDAALEDMRALSVVFPLMAWADELDNAAQPPAKSVLEES